MHAFHFGLEEILEWKDDYLTIAVVAEVEEWWLLLWRYLVQFHTVKASRQKSLNPKTALHASVGKGAWTVIAHWDKSFLPSVCECECGKLNTHLSSKTLWVVKDNLGFNQNKHHREEAGVLIIFRTCSFIKRTANTKSQTLLTKKYVCISLVICHWPCNCIHRS